MNYVNDYEKTGLGLEWELVVQVRQLKREQVVGETHKISLVNCVVQVDEGKQ